MPRKPRLSSAASRRLKHASPAAKYRETIRLIDRGSSLSDALKQTHLGRRTFHNLNAGSRSVVKSGGRYRVPETTRKTWQIYDQTGKSRFILVVGQDRVRVAQYNDAVIEALQNNSSDPLAPFVDNPYVRDINGKRYSLNTDLQTLKKLRQEQEPPTTHDFDVHSGSLFQMAA